LSGAQEAPSSAADILSRQHLFSVYVHAPPDFPGELARRALRPLPCRPLLKPSPVRGCTSGPGCCIAVLGRGIGTSGSRFAIACGIHETPEATCRQPTAGGASSKQAHAKTQLAATNYILTRRHGEVSRLKYSMLPRRHPLPLAGYPADSLFGGEGTLIAKRVPTSWGSHSLVEAAQALLWAAAADPANQRQASFSRQRGPMDPPQALEFLLPCLPPPFLVDPISALGTC
jgi:hypothetical protein